MINIAYIFPFWSIFVMLFIKDNNSISRKLYILISFVPVFFALLTKDVIYGSDMYRYLVTFQEIANGTSFATVSYKFDIGFLVINKLISYISSDSNFFIFITNFIYIMLLSRLIYKKSFNIYYVTLLYICCGFCYYPTNILRSSIAVMIFANTSIVFFNNIFYPILFLLISSSIHMSMATFCISFIVIDKIKKYLIFIIAPISIGIFVSYEQYIKSKFFLPTALGATLPIAIIYILISLFVLYNLKKIKYHIQEAKYYALLTLCAGIFLLISFKYFIFTRLYISFSVFIPLLLDVVAKNLKNDLRIFFISISSLLYILYYISMVYYNNFSF